MIHSAQTTEPMPANLILLETVSQWVNVDESDPSLARLVKSAALWAEGYCRQPLFRRTYVIELEGFEDGYLPGVNPEIVSITYIDGDGQEQTLEERTHYKLLTTGLLRFWIDDRTKSVTITYQAGYEAGEVPEDIQDAMLLKIEHRFDNRADTIEERTTAAQKLLYPYHYPIL
ncbi:hypothetical protein BN8_03654 [Fibrisoma limi BUZ 3]|uniref:Phage gp6-like head-tail connector protein n=1 Tax=Fibrisoma limi BUZ 3 TaxID=1185876 RepID=I2GKQ4_9BACT|nr:phage gp6-like head-tail connector protein [Fibrisoma limi]CCH54480.1 hypothetical protein BN8_03654 [Fibrisoma limi BUZ 3]